MIHLDTSFLVRGLIRGSSEDVLLHRWLRDGEQLGMCAVAWTELLCGPLAETEIALALRLVSERPPFSEDDAAVAAELFNVGGRRRGSLADCMIAAAAVRAEAPLATSNGRDFEAFVARGLVLASR